VNMGLQNEGKGWFAFFDSPSHKVDDRNYPYPGNYDRAASTYSNVKWVEFSVSAYIIDDIDSLSGIFYFYDIDDGLLDLVTLTFDVPRGSFYSADKEGSPIVKFSRFMSLSPKRIIIKKKNDTTTATTPGKDDRDLTYMKNAKFSGLLLHNRLLGFYENWNMNLINYAWSVQTANILTLRISRKNESGDDLFSIHHLHKYH
jgi:hypothetical protein